MIDEPNASKAVLIVADTAFERADMAVTVMPRHRWTICLPAGRRVI